MTEQDKQALKDAGIPVDGYSLRQLEADIQAVQPRFFDIWVVPPVMLWFAVKAKGMPRNARRILFAGGVYSMYRNYTRYKESAAKLAAIARERIQDRPEGGGTEGGSANA